MSASRRPPSALPEEISLEISAAITPAELTDEQRSSLRARVLQGAGDEAPQGTRTFRAAHTQWTTCAPYIQMKVLRQDALTGYQIVLLHMQPGGVMPAHRHTQDEEFIVLEGECQIGSHRLHAGDVHLAEAGSWHPRITTQTGVMVLLRGEYSPSVSR
jgi:quercetin dioxygenase-like cupin family protein